jgi:hypothetical protein
MAEQNMSDLEFGHSAGAIHKGRVDCWGTGPFIIEAEGKKFRFGDSDRFGPYLCDKHGDPLANELPPERSGFWIAHRSWVRGGRRVDADGVTCIYDLLRPTTYRRIAGNHAVIVEAGDEGGGYIEIKGKRDAK